MSNHSVSARYTVIVGLLGVSMQFVFFDIEASAIEGYPIEVGWAVVELPEVGEGAVVEVDSLLIRPAERWLDDLPWDDESERVHGITLDEVLEKGLPPAEVADRLNVKFSDEVLYSDAVWADGAWLDMLFRAAERPPKFNLAHVVEAARRLPAHRKRIQPKIVASPPIVHRAAADAERWARIFLAALEPQ